MVVKRHISVEQYPIRFGVTMLWTQRLINVLIEQHNRKSTMVKAEEEDIRATTLGLAIKLCNGRFGIRLLHERFPD